MSLTTSIFGQSTPSTNPIDYAERNLAIILKQSGNENTSVKDFYMAGRDCYRHTLKKIAYLANPDGIILFFNDPLGNCIFAESKIPQPTSIEQQGTVCYISNAIFQQLYTSKNKVAAFNYEQSTELSNEFIHMIDILDQCASPISQKKLLLLLESSTQLRSTKKN